MSLARRSVYALSLLTWVCCTSACGSGPAMRSGRTVPLAQRDVDRDSFADVRREYLVLSPDDPIRAAVQARLLAFLADDNDALLRAGSYEAVVERLAEMTELLLPVDLRAGASLPAVFGPIARFVMERGEPRGDEPRVLAALLILSRLEPDEASHLAEYERAAIWGHDARLGGPSDDRSLFDRLEGGIGLVGIWEEHARLAPAPEVLDRLAHLHIELRDRLMPTAERGFSPPRSMADLDAMSYVSAMIERAPLEVAATYLRVGDLATASERVGEMGDASGTEWRVRRILDEAAGDGDEAVAALTQLAIGFAEVRPDVSIAVCRNGRRRFPTVSDFPLCLARLSAEHAADGTAWYAEAVRLAPDEREVYDEAIERIPPMLDLAIENEEEIGAIRALVADAGWILEQRALHWPSEPAPLTEATLRLRLAAAEESAGNVDRARAALESSLDLDRSGEALAALARLELSTSHATLAADLYEQALASLTDQSRGGRITRALLFHELGDARRFAGDGPGSLRTYRQALDTYVALIHDRDVDARSLALLHVRVGIVSRRLGDRAASDTALRAAMSTTPDWTDPFAEALAALVVDEPDARLAAEAFHAARVGSPLSPALKVYLALRAQLASERAGTEPDPEIVDVLNEYSTSEGWPGRLAALGAGTAAPEEVLAAATSSGERCQAHFYAGARLLAAHDAAGAESAFRAAVDTGMVRYLEYWMALELLAAD